MLVLIYFKTKNAQHFSTQCFPPQTTICAERVTTTFFRM